MFFHQMALQPRYHFARASSRARHPLPFALMATAKWSESSSSALEHSKDADGELGLVVGLDSLCGLAQRSGVDLASGWMMRHSGSGRVQALG